MSGRVANSTEKKKDLLRKHPNFFFNTSVVIFLKPQFLGGGWGGCTDPSSQLDTQLHCPTNISTTRATPTAKPLVAIIDGGCSKGSFFFFFHHVIFQHLLWR